MFFLIPDNGQSFRTRSTARPVLQLESRHSVPGDSRRPGAQSDRAKLAPTWRLISTRHRANTSTLWSLVLVRRLSIEAVQFTLDLLAFRNSWSFLNDKENAPVVAKQFLQSDYLKPDFFRHVEQHAEICILQTNSYWELYTTRDTCFDTMSFTDRAKPIQSNKWKDA